MPSQRRSFTQRLSARGLSGRRPWRCARPLAVGGGRVAFHQDSDSTPFPRRCRRCSALRQQFNTSLLLVTASRASSSARCSRSRRSGAGAWRPTAARSARRTLSDRRIRRRHLLEQALEHRSDRRALIGHDAHEPRTAQAPERRRQRPQVIRPSSRTPTEAPPWKTPLSPRRAGG